MPKRERILFGIVVLSYGLEKLFHASGKGPHYNIQEEHYGGREGPAICRDLRDDHSKPRIIIIGAILSLLGRTVLRATIARPRHG